MSGTTRDFQATAVKGSTSDAGVTTFGWSVACPLGSCALQPLNTAISNVRPPQGKRFFIGFVSIEFG